MVEYNRYPEYKDSGVERLGEIPVGWDAHGISKNSTTISGSGFPHEYQHLETEDIPFLKVNSLAKANRDGVIHWQYDTVSPETAKMLNAKIIPTGSIVIAKVGAALLLGRIRILAKDACIDNNMTAIIFDDTKVFNRFGYYALQQIDFKTIVSPGVIPSLNDKALKSFSFAWPTMDVQKQIVAFLDSETKKIDDSVSSMESLISLLTEKRAALISETVTRGVPGDNTEFKDSGVEWLGEVPAAWDYISFGQLFNRIKTMGTGREELLSVYREFGVIPKSSRSDNHNAASEDLSKYQIVKKDDLVINKMKAWQGSLAISEYNGIVSPAYYVFENKPKYNNNLRFLHYLMRSNLYKGFYASISKGIRIGQWDLDQKSHKKMPIFIPSINEQNRIVSFIDGELPKIDTIISEAKNSILLLKEKRQTLIVNVVMGKIDVSSIINQ